MNIGKLDCRIAIYRATESRDSTGAVNDVWGFYRYLWASKSEQGGREFRNAGVLMSETTALFTVRYTDDLTTADKISHGGKTYDILSISEVGRRESLLVQCKTEATP